MTRDEDCICPEDEIDTWCLACIQCTRCGCECWEEYPTNDN